MNKCIFFITFHQNYSYEEFLGGLRPDTDTSNGLKFKWKPGIFLHACTAAHFAAFGKVIDFNKLTEEQAGQRCKEFLDAIKDTDFDTSQYKSAGRVILVIDEINRANISRVFGELITLIEEDKRLGGEHQMTVLLPTGNSFGVPANLVIIGTMNTADKSIALIDVALRRRFEFFDLYPTEDRVKELVKNEDYAKILNKLNELILKEKKSLDFMIGYSFFMGSNRKLDYIFNYKIIPLLTEYFNNRLDDVQKVLTGLNTLLEESGYRVDGIVESKKIRANLLRVVEIKKTNNSNIEMGNEAEKAITEDSASEVEA